MSNSNEKDVYAKIHFLNEKIRNEKKEIYEEKVKPLEDAAEKLKQEEYSKIDNFYKQELDSLCDERFALEQREEKERIDIAKNAWHPQGTILTLWKHQRWEREPSKTDIKGIVQIYDGTQQISSNLRWRKPSIGDVLIFFLKKDGTMGSKFDEIGYKNNLKPHKAKFWLLDNETPKDNLYITKYEQHER